MNGFSHSTQQRHKHVRSIVQRLQTLGVHLHDEPDTVVAVLHQLLGPGTALTYTHTLAALYPTIRQHPQWRNALRFASKIAAHHKPRQAVLAQLSQMSNVTSQAMTGDVTAESTALLTFLAQYIRCDRHCDLIDGRISHTFVDSTQHLLIIRIEYRTSKSDPLGKRFFSKTIELPLRPDGTRPRLTQRLIDAMTVPASYDSVRSAVEPLGLTPHSARVSAVTDLTTAGFSEDDIMLMSGHVTSNEPRQVWRYTAPRPDSAIARKQRAMSAQLLRSATSSITIAE